MCPDLSSKPSRDIPKANTLQRKSKSGFKPGEDSLLSCAHVFSTQSCPRNWNVDFSPAYLEANTTIPVEEELRGSLTPSATRDKQAIADGKERHRCSLTKTPALGSRHTQKEAHRPGVSSRREGLVSHLGTRTRAWRPPNIWLWKLKGLCPGPPG